MTHTGIAGLVDTTTTRHLFFTGKGGVGKTSAACATAIGLAQAGRSVLLVSTDPASNLAEVLGQDVGTSPTQVLEVSGLSALNVDPEAAAAAYRERVIGPYRGVLPDSAVARVEEQLSGACTVEIAAFDEFTALLTDTAVTSGFDHIVFDTAPTGHTLRLLALPAAWSTFIGDGTGTSCLGPLSGMAAQQGRYTQAVSALSDPTSTTLVLVARPEPASLAEAQRASTELRALGIGHQRLVVNGLFTATPGTNDRLAAAMDTQARNALDMMPAKLAGLPRSTVALRTTSPMGISELRLLAEDTVSVDSPATDGELTPVDSGSFHELIDTLAAAGAGLVMTMGKGGVGKTTVAAAVAVALAERGHRVHLTTTDPAAHIAEAIGSVDGSDLNGLAVSRINPVAETAAYTAEVLANAGAGLDDGARAVLEEDLASPCTEEIAVFQAFARTVAAAQDAFVVIDTAPTGHTLLLLDAARTYHSELTRQSGQMPEHVLHLLDRLRDPTRTHVLLVALAEATPVHEAARLQADLARSGITPAAWVINQSLASAQPTDPMLVARATSEHRYLTEVATTLTKRLVVLPRLAEAPTGAGRLRALVADPVPATR
jgi:arsenite/tail-anchored protein-transporting ATPase